MAFHSFGTRHVLLSSLFALCVADPAPTQTLGPAFSTDYSLESLSLVPGVPGPYGGLEFKDGNPNKLLVVGMGNDPLATIYEVDVTRDASGHVNGFAGAATVLASAPDADGGLHYGPGGVLFYTAYPSNILGQIKPGSTAPDKLFNLSTAGIAPSTGGVSITPGGFPGAGRLKITSYDADAWYDADLVPDGSGTFDVVNGTLRASLPGVGPESIIYVDSSYPAFTNQSVIINEWFVETAGAYEIDGNGDPIPSTRRDFLTCCGYWPLGSALDPLTGDFLFADYASGDQLIVVKTMPIGTNYCISLPNSSGSAATISAEGSTSIAVANLSLTAQGLPPGVQGLFYYGTGQVALPFGDSFRCVGGAAQRLPIGQASASGVLFQPDLFSLPMPNLPLAVSTFNFQAWFRDPPAMLSGFSLSNGVSVSFGP